MRSVLFVCLGNICRSPLAEAILRRQAKEANLELRIDSAGTGDWHVGSPPDPRAIQIGTEHGCDMALTARQFNSADFETFDVILAMDQSNLSALKRWSGARQDKIRLASSYDPHSKHQEVPDPYYGDLEDFRQVAKQLEKICAGIVEHAKSHPD